MKKKFVIIALAGVMAASLAGCGRSSNMDLTLDEQYDEVMRIKDELDAEDELIEEEEEEIDELDEEIEEIHEEEREEEGIEEDEAEEDE